MATQQNAIASVAREITGATEQLLNNEPGAREKLVSLAYSLAGAVELPSETILRMAFAEVCPPNSSHKYSLTARVARPLCTLQNRNRLEDLRNSCFRG